MEHVFVSHAHIDHFIGFDHLLRVLVGREKKIWLYGPVGFIEHVYHKLAAYRWNLVDRFAVDLTFAVTEIDPDLAIRAAHLRPNDGFAVEPAGGGRLLDGLLHVDPAFRVTTPVLEHRTPCLGFAVQETAHVNVWNVNRRPNLPPDWSAPPELDSFMRRF